MTATLHSLLLSCQDGDGGRVRRILDSGEVGVNAPDETGITAVQVAAANDQMAVLEVLREFKANVNQSNNVGWSPLHQACWHGHTETVRCLIDQGADLNQRNKFGAGALTLAAASGHLSTVRLLLESGLKPETAPEYRTCPSATMSAALHGRDGALRMLLNRGVKPDPLSVPARWTPLMFAAAGGSKPCCQLLLERSADPNKQNLLGATALEVATALGNSEVRPYLESKTRNKKPLHVNPEMDLITAAREGDLEKVEALLSLAETNVDIQDREGATPLILAAVGGHLTITQLLIGLGSNLDHQDHVNGWTALMQATFFNHIDIVKVLIHHKADLTLVGHTGCTALDLATLVDDKNSELVRLLAEHTIQQAPPNLVLTPTTRRQPPRLAFGSRSFSEAHLDVFQPSGLKGIWSKLSKKFKRSDLTPGPEPGFVETPAPLDQNGLGIQSLVPQSAVFTLGFTSTTTISTATADKILVASPPNFRHFLHDTSCSPGKFCMPAGKEGDTNSVTGSKYPTITRLLSFSDSGSHLRTRNSSGPQLPARNNSVDPPVKQQHVKKSSKRHKKSSSKELSVQYILKKLGLQHLYPVFAREEVDLPALLAINDDDLKEIGVSEAAERKLLLDYVYKLTNS